MTPEISSPVLRVRKLADKSEGERVVRFDPVTGERKLVNPYTEGDEHESWPFAGIQIEGEAPKSCRVPTSWVESGVQEGWIELENPRAVSRPGGPPSDPWRPDKVHNFRHADAVVLKTIDGDVRYVVTGQPDKYVAGGKPGDPVTDAIYAAGDTEVAHYYTLKLEG